MCKETINSLKGELSTTDQFWVKVTYIHKWMVHVASRFFSSWLATDLKRNKRIDEIMFHDWKIGTEDNVEKVESRGPFLKTLGWT